MAAENIPDGPGTAGIPVSEITPVQPIRSVDVAATVRLARAETDIHTGADAATPTFAVVREYPLKEAATRDVLELVEAKTRWLPSSSALSPTPVNGTKTCTT